MLPDLLSYPGFLCPIYVFLSPVEISAFSLNSWMWEGERGGKNTQRGHCSTSGPWWTGKAAAIVIATCRLEGGWVQLGFGLEWSRKDCRNCVPNRECVCISWWGISWVMVFQHTVCVSLHGWRQGYSTHIYGTKNVRCKERVYKNHPGNEWVNGRWAFIGAGPVLAGV